MQGGVLAITSNAPCISFAGSSVCAGATTGIGLFGIDQIFATAGTIKDIGTSFPITSFKTADLTIPGGPAIFDLENIVTPSGLPACTFTTSSGSCSTGTFVLTQQSFNQFSLSLTTNEIGYLGSSGTGSTPYMGVFTTQISGNLGAFGCVAAGAQTCTDTIANFLIFEATAAQTFAAGLGPIGQSGTVKTSWTVTESPNITPLQPPSQSASCCLDLA